LTVNFRTLKVNKPVILHDITECGIDDLLEYPTQNL